MTLAAALIALAAFAFGGCAYNVPYASKTVETIDPMTGKVMGRTESVLRTRTVALWPATSLVAKQSSSLTSAGTLRTGAEGISTDAGAGTNDVQLIKETTTLIRAARGL